MRILSVTPCFFPAHAFGGPVKVAFDLGKELVERGHEVVVFTSDAKDPESRLDVENDRIKGMDVYYFKNLSMSIDHDLVDRGHPKCHACEGDTEPSE